MTDSESTHETSKPDDGSLPDEERKPEAPVDFETPDAAPDTPFADAPSDTEPKDETHAPEAEGVEPVPDEAAPVASSDDTHESTDGDGEDGEQHDDAAAGDLSADEVPADEAPADGAPGDGAPESNAATGGGATPKARKKKPKKKRRPLPMRAPEPPPLPPEFKDEALAAATARVIAEGSGSADATRAALEALRAGRSLAFLGRYRRRLTGGLDERRLRALRDRFEEVLVLEERRIGIRELLRKRGALSDEAAEKLAEAGRVSEMEDLAAPYLPVVASRATVARGHGFQPLADAIRAATEAGPLSDVAKPFVPEGSESTAIDQALAGARDILAEDLSLDPVLRAKLRRLFHEKGMLTVALRPDRKGDAGRHGNLVGFSERALKVPALKVLSIRRAEKDRVVTTSIEPPEDQALALVDRYAAASDHPHAGFLRAAAEDGYRRILKPVIQNEIRLEVKATADELAIATFERNLRNLLLGPLAGPCRTLGVRPDVQGGHRWCAIDQGGDPVGAGQLPHEPTAGREACLEELRQVLKTYEASAIAVGTTGGRAEAISLASEAVAGRQDVVVAEVVDGGTRAIEGMGPLELDERPPVPAANRGALSLARRFQDPLAELVRIDPKALGLGPGVHDVHQGRLRRMFDDAMRSCVAHAGANPNVADVDLLSRLPGFDRAAAQAFVAWREAGGRLTEKAQLAAVAGVGPNVAEESVGFLRIPDAPDPRDRTQLHPEQYGLAERIAEQVGTDLATLFSEPKVRARAQLDELVDDETGIHTLRYVLFQATAGAQDPRPRYAMMIAPPEAITLESLTPGLILQGRVMRAAPFGVFVDVGLGSDALIPTPHVGDRPGVEQATVAPVGAIVTARVLEVDPKKKKLTLTMRRDAGPPRAAGPRGRGPQRGRGPREGGRGPDDRARGPDDRARGPRDAGRRTSRDRVGAGARGEGQGGPGASKGSSGPGASKGPSGPGASKGPPRGRTKGRPRKSGKFGGADRGFSIFDRRGGRDDRRGGGPRNLSLKPDEPAGPPDAEVVDESKLTEEELMQRKLDALKRKLEGDRG